MPRKLPVESRCRRRISVQNFKPPEIRQSSLNHRPLKPGLEHHLGTGFRFYTVSIKTSVSSKPPPPLLRRRAAAERALQTQFRAKVRQSVESTRTATIQSQLMIKATSQQRRKPGTGEQQGDIRGSTLAPATTATNSTARNACQGTYPPSRRPQSVLRGPSRGEEATKKLLAIRSVQKANSPRLLGIRRILPADAGAARAQLQHRVHPRSPQF